MMIGLPSHYQEFSLKLLIPSVFNLVFIFIYKIKCVSHLPDPPPHLLQFYDKLHQQ